jgi:hypothetical protein
MTNPTAITIKTNTTIISEFIAISWLLVNKDTSANKNDVPVKCDDQYPNQECETGGPRSFGWESAAETQRGIESNDLYCRRPVIANEKLAGVRPNRVGRRESLLKTRTCLSEALADGWLGGTLTEQPLIDTVISIPDDSGTEVLAVNTSQPSATQPSTAEQVIRFARL